MIHFVHIYGILIYKCSQRHRFFKCQRDHFLNCDRPGFALLFTNKLAWLPLQSLAVKKTFLLVQILGGEQLLYNLLKSAGDIFLSGLRRAKNVLVAFWIVFRIFFRVFQTVFRIDLKFFRGEFRSADMPP